MKIDRLGVNNSTVPKEQQSWAGSEHSEHNKECFLQTNPEDQVHYQRNNQLDMLRRFATTGRI